MPILMSHRMGIWMRKRYDIQRRFVRRGRVNDGGGRRRMKIV
jgi:hypothetical protein